ncbi:MAG: D-alanine--D-alanine ligase, partial [Bacteroidota bacterium]
MKIAVLFGGISTERNVSITGGRAVINALREKGHEVIGVDPAFGKDAVRDDDEINGEVGFLSLEELKKFDPRKMMECINSSIFDDVDVAFNVLHGRYGEDGIIQALLELRGIPYTGSDIKASSLAMDKITSKVLMASAGVPTPEFEILRRGDEGDYDYYAEIRSAFGQDIVIKPNNQGSTIGITIVRGGNLDDIHQAVVTAMEYSDNIIIERYIPGAEITVGIVGEETLPIIEIVPQEGYYDYEHKYIKGRTEYICPAELDENLSEFIQNMAYACYRVHGCAGFSRVDFRLTDEG